jgi:hypothetical protein
MIRLLEEWLPLLAGLSGVVVPVYDARFDDRGTPGLEQQLQDILNFVAFQQLSSRSARTSGRARVARHDRPNGVGPFS